MIMAKKTKGWFVQENVYVICAYQIVTFFVRRANGDNGAWHVAETLAQLHLSYVGTCVLLASFNVKLSSVVLFSTAGYPSVGYTSKKRFSCLASKRI